ncbi:pullulanase [Rhodosalinus sediminis]|uniref:Pullulanase n=1 Tax=Rhodosalinus sediminis TaxID=1940533 RepID=A0A3D9BWD2_9RHOB|nr:photosynthetic complex assembly protein PuhC [Rhodosalinus sediminis]REC57840.1 pullulanase [Rhodosalinus sediminis]
MSQTARPPRTYTPEHRIVPVVLVRAMFGLVMAVLVIVSIAVWTGRPVTSTPPESPVTHARMLHLEGDMSGAATVRAADGTIIADLSPEEGGFVSGVYRVLHRERTKHGVALDGPVELRRHENGRFSVHDPSTGWGADLMGFGRDNAEAFAKLLLK